MKSTEKNKKQKQVNQNKGRGALEKWVPMVENHMNRKESKKNPRERHERKPRQNANESIYSNPQKFCESMGNPKIREEAMEEKKRRLHWWRSNKWPESDAQTWKQKKTKNEERIGNSRPSLKKSPCCPTHLIHNDSALTSKAEPQPKSNSFYKEVEPSQTWRKQKDQQRSQDNLQ